MRGHGKGAHPEFNPGDRVQHAISHRMGKVVACYSSSVFVLFDGDKYRTTCLAVRLKRVSDPGDTT